MRTLLACLSLACAAAVLIISRAEKQQEAALDARLADAIAGLVATQA